MLFLNFQGWKYHCQRLRLKVKDGLCVYPPFFPSGALVEQPFTGWDSWDGANMVEIWSNIKNISNQSGQIIATSHDLTQMVGK